MSEQEKIEEWAKQLIMYPTVDYADAEKIVREIIADTKATQTHEQTGTRVLV